MTGSDTTTRTDNSVRFHPIPKAKWPKAIWTGPVARTIRVQMDKALDRGQIKAIWNNEIGDAT